jgi:hypothetical protein
VDANAPDGFLVHSFAGNDPIICKDHVRERLGLPPFKAKGKGNGSDKAKVQAVYDYRDAGGELLFQVVRFAPKDFRQRRPDGNGGWLWSLGKTPRVLYRLPELIEAVAMERAVFVAGAKRPSRH